MYFLSFTENMATLANRIVFNFSAASSAGKDIVLIYGVAIFAVFNWESSFSDDNLSNDLIFLSSVFLGTRKIFVKGNRKQREVVISENKYSQAYIANQLACVAKLFQI